MPLRSELAWKITCSPLGKRVDDFEDILRQLLEPREPPRVEVDAGEKGPVRVRGLDQEVLVGVVDGLLILGQEVVDGELDQLRCSVEFDLEQTLGDVGHPRGLAFDPVGVDEVEPVLHALVLLGADRVPQPVVELVQLLQQVVSGLLDLEQPLLVLQQFIVRVLECLDLDGLVVGPLDDVEEAPLDLFVANQEGLSELLELYQGLLDILRIVRHH